MSSNSATQWDSTRIAKGNELLTGKALGQRAGVVHNDLRPVFVLGHGSSGTSILARLLQEELGVAFGTESQFLIRYYRRLHLYGDLSQERNRRRLVDHLLTERWFERSAKFGFSTNAEAIVNRIEEPTYRGVLEAVFGELADQLGMNRWGNKTPEYNLNLNVIDTLFPDAVYIRMTRDGRDVFVSLKNRYWGPKNIYCAAQEWRHEVELIDEFLSHVPEERRFDTSYEIVSEQPVQELYRLIEFLGIEDPDGGIRERIAKEAPGKVKPGNHGKWRAQMTPKQVDRYERLACQSLMKHGYDCTITTPRTQKNQVARLGYRLHNRLKKYTFARYWKDNLYKARLRCLDLWRQYT